MKTNSLVTLIVTAFAGMLLTGCVSTSPQTVTLQSNALPRPGAKVLLGQVTNASGKTFDLPVEEMLRKAVINSLQKENLLPAAPPPASDLALDLQITDYAPGNAFKRWLVPGYGSTVLSVRGTLRNARDSSPVGTIEHSRSIGFGGLFTVGAWTTIIDSVAGDIAHDLQLKIEKGGEFVLQIAPRAQRAPSAPVDSEGFAVKLIPLGDQRAEMGRIGLRTAAFNVKMGDVYFSRIVPAYFSEALGDELQLVGGKLVESGEDLQVSGRLTRFWVATNTTPLYWDIVAEVECDLIITPTSSPATPVQKHFAGQKKVRTYLWPSAQLMSGALEGSLDDLFNHLRADEIWRSPAPAGSSAASSQPGSP